MRKAFGLALLTGIVLALLRRSRRSADQPGTVSVGFTDGSSTTLDTGSPERELILATAAEALA